MSVPLLLSIVKRWRHWHIHLTLNLRGDDCAAFPNERKIWDPFVQQSLYTGTDAKKQTTTWFIYSTGSSWAAKQFMWWTSVDFGSHQPSIILLHASSQLLKTLLDEKGLVSCLCRTLTFSMCDAFTGKANRLFVCGPWKQQRGRQRDVGVWTCVLVEDMGDSISQVKLRVTSVAPVTWFCIGCLATLLFCSKWFNLKHIFAHHLLARWLTLFYFSLLHHTVLLFLHGL